MKQILILKIGSSTLTEGGDTISRNKLTDIAKQAYRLQKTYHIIIVSSGAVAAAKQHIQFGKDMPSKQALAAIGQPKLMRMYDEVFCSVGLTTAQCLLTYRDFSDNTSKQNTKNTLYTLIKHNVIPIINENDTTAVEELIVGDNDTLSALVAVATEAKLLVIASDINGLYNKNPHVHKDAELIHEVNDIASVSQHIEEISTKHGTGGMTTKFEAATLCMKHGIIMKIVGGHNENFVIRALNKISPCTTFNSDTISKQQRDMTRQNSDTTLK